jgi:hypothetical protein
MPRPTLVVVSMVLVFAVAAGSGTSAPTSSQLVRRGVGIGKIRLGMTYPEVRRALGRPQLVNRVQNRGFGTRYVEYLWNYGDWRVGLLGPRGRERVVRVSTKLRRERTREGVGVGSTVRQLARHYRRTADCVHRDYNVPDAGTWIVLRGPGSRMTAFWLAGQTIGYRPRKPPVVGEVLVQYAWMTPIADHCSEDWTRP